VCNLRRAGTHFVVVQHPMIAPTLYANMDTTWERMYVFQPYRSHGSLKDRIYDVRRRHRGSPWS